MPVFDFNNAPEEKKEVVCTYTTFSSNEKTTSAEKPILVLDNKKKQWKHHSSGKFTNPTKATTFEFEEEDGTVTADIFKIASRLSNDTNSISAAAKSMLEGRISKHSNSVDWMTSFGCFCPTNTS